MWRIHPNGEKSGSHSVTLTLGANGVPSAQPRPYKIIGYAFSFGAWDAKVKYINWYPDLEYTHPSHEDAQLFADQFYLLTDPYEPSTRAQQIQSICHCLSVLLDSKDEYFSTGEPKTDLEQINHYYSLPSETGGSCYDRMILLLSVLQTLSRQGRLPIYDLEGCRFCGPGGQGDWNENELHYFIRGTFWNGIEWVNFMADAYSRGAGGWAEEDPGTTDDPCLKFWTTGGYDGWKNVLNTAEYVGPSQSYTVYLFHGYAAHHTGGHEFNKNVAVWF